MPDHDKLRFLLKRRVMQVSELLMSAVKSVVQQNKKHYALTLHDGQALQLKVADMFNVHVLQQGHPLACVHFQPLSSLNNIEMQPIYRVASLRTAAGEDAQLSAELLECVFAVYRYYTNGSIRPWRYAVK
jgi:hypothetical protein